MPWAEPVPPPAAVLVPSPAPVPKPKNIFAKLVPWASRKALPPNSPPAPENPTAHAPSPAASWALPKLSAAELAAAPVAQTEMEFARDLRRPADTAGEPTAEQLVTLLSRLTARKGEPQAPPTPQTPYKARPISFAPTRWELFEMWAHTHRLRLSLAGTLLTLALITAYLWKLVSLNAEIDHQWRPLEKALHARYALVPAYVECLDTYTDGERYTVRLTERALTAWRTARTEEQFVHAAASMEQTLILLVRAIKRQEQALPAMDPDQLDSSLHFAELEKQRERSRLVAIAIVHHYNALVADYNDRVDHAPGSWLAHLAHLEPHAPIFGGNRE